MINVGVIGVGYLGQHHARIYSEIARESGAVRLAAVVDSDRKRAEEIASIYGCEPFTDYKDAFKKVDAFSIATPTTSHYSTAIDCIDAGKDLLIEKPITDTLENANSLINAADRKGVIIQTGHLERYNPVVSAVYPLLNNPFFFDAERLSPFLGRGIDVDITLDLMIHDIDIIFALMGQKREISDIKASGAAVMTDKIDIAKTWIEFDGGVQALMTASRLSSAKSRKLRIFQKDSYLVIDYQNMQIKRFLRSKKGASPEIINVEKKEPLKEELKDFVSCLSRRSRPLVCAIQGRNALKLALKIGEQIRQGIL
ncbi:MAG: Gfo/Idh/MocA family oxidoreductase [Nitrospirae bacterium]|nr:Gfo/Idh/MocA family oxidoreductase [Nitrospirota bacterium]